MKVLFVTAGDEEMASTRYRVLNQLPHLRGQGVSCSTVESPGKGGVTAKMRFAMRVLREANSHDILYVQKVLLPPWYLRLISPLVDAIVFDFDDALYTTPPGESGGRPEMLNANLSIASAVVAGSPILESYAKSYASEVHCLPTSLPKDDYIKWMGRRTNAGPRLGWIGNPENLVYLDTIASTLDHVLESHSDTDLLVITAGNLPVEPLRHRDDVIYKEWSQDSELELLSTVDIGLRPLTDDEWTRAKGGFTSVVQCMALQLPVVVTPVGMLENIIDHGETGYFATSDDEWVELLSRLIESPNLRNQIGKQAHESLSQQRFWTEQRASDLYEILMSEYRSS